MTMGKALNISKLAKGGHVLAFFDCVDGNYVPENTCSGWLEPLSVTSSEDEGLSHLNLSAQSFLVWNSTSNRTLNATFDPVSGAWDIVDPGQGYERKKIFPGKTYTCYADSPTKALPVNRLFSYLDKVSKAGAPSSGRFWSMQALWQEDAESILIGTLHGSSLLADETRSQLNHQLISAVSAGHFPSINLLEVNNVCDGGLDLLKALRAKIPSFSSGEAEILI
eukprot:TRINITY_DN26088_c0_g1_i2.p1 TRINITY_DN26088_c0_g1~~TRINITY_DN26088_c0_g1_i2.p1  ORF type:complete len:223 (+),score=27.16 TRINITY_DN26088_c0_g1_i2:139-807(+)